MIAKTNRMSIKSTEHDERHIDLFCESFNRGESRGALTLLAPDADETDDDDDAVDNADVEVDTANDVGVVGTLLDAVVVVD